MTHLFLLLTSCPRRCQRHTNIQLKNVSKMLAESINFMQELLASWSQPFGQAHNSADCQHIELSLVDSVVCLLQANSA